MPSQEVGLLKSLRPFERTSVADDLHIIKKFFGLDPAGQALAKLVGTTPSSLSRAKDGQSIRTASHIAVLAALAIEGERYFAAQGRPGGVGTTAMNRWLYSGKLRTREGFQTPIEALSDIDVAHAALREVREARRTIQTSAREAPPSDHGSDPGSTDTAKTTDKPHQKGAPRVSAPLAAQSRHV